jgi:hypothetical protein
MYMFMPVNYTIHIFSQIANYALYFVRYNIHFIYRNILGIRLSDFRNHKDQ